MYTLTEKEYSEAPAILPGQVSLIDKFQIKNKFKELNDQGINQFTQFVIHNIPQIVKKNESGVDIDINRIDSVALKKLGEFFFKYEQEKEIIREEEVKMIVEVAESEENKNDQDNFSYDGDIQNLSNNKNSILS